MSTAEGYGLKEFIHNRVNIIISSLHHAGCTHKAFGYRLSCELHVI